LNKEVIIIIIIIIIIITMEHVVDNSTACGLREARPHPVDHPPRAPELGEGAAGMELTPL